MLKIADVCAIVGVNRWTIYYHIKNNGFPQPIKDLAHKTARWHEPDVLEWKRINMPMLRNIKRAGVEA